MARARTETHAPAHVPPASDLRRSKTDRPRPVPSPASAGVPGCRAARRPSGWARPSTRHESACGPDPDAVAHPQPVRRRRSAWPLWRKARRRHPRQSPRWTTSAARRSWRHRGVSDMQKLLILGGTTEATFLATSLAGDTRFATILSFAGATRTPRPPPVSWRVGGFGGAEGLAAFLRGEGIDLLIDATHPFAARMKRNAVAAAQFAGIRMLGILRPPWQPQPGDRWIMVPDMANAASAL